MEDDLVIIGLLREKIIEAVEACTDENLLDLVFKLLIMG